jgi:hypothetical protein
MGPMPKDISGYKQLPPVGGSLTTLPTLRTPESDWAGEKPPMSFGLKKSLPGSLTIPTREQFFDTPPAGSGKLYTAVMPPFGMKYVYKLDGTRVIVPINYSQR